MSYPSAADRGSGKSRRAAVIGRCGGRMASLYYADLNFKVFAVPVKQMNDTLQFGSAEQLVSNLCQPNLLLRCFA
jgi:hypothetical protein